AAWRRRPSATCSASPPNCARPRSTSSAWWRRWDATSANASPAAGCASTSTSRDGAAACRERSRWPSTASPRRRSPTCRSTPRRPRCTCACASCPVWCGSTSATTVSASTSTGRPGWGSVWWACASAPASSGAASRCCPGRAGGPGSAPVSSPTAAAPAASPRTRRRDRRCWRVGAEAVSAGTIRVLLADDHALFREGVRSLLEAQPGFEVVGEVEDGRSAVQQALALRPDVVLMDITMPRLDGVEATRQITARDSSVRVLMLTMHDNEEVFFRALGAGAAGYVLKRSGGHELINAIRSTHEGNSYLSPFLAKALMTDYLQRVDRS